MTEAITRFYTEKGLKSRINKIKKQKKAMAKRLKQKELSNSLNCLKH